MALPLAVKAGNLRDVGAYASVEGGSLLGLRSRRDRRDVLLSSLLIEQACDDVVERKIFGGGRVERNDEVVVGRGKSSSEDQDHVFVVDGDVDLGEFECETTGFRNKDLHRPLGLLQLQELAAEREARSHAAGLVHFGEVIPDDAGVGVTDERELCRLDVQHELSARFGLLLPRKIFGGGRVERNDEVVVGRGKSSSEDQDHVFVVDGDVDLGEFECETTGFRNKDLHRPLGLLQLQELAAEREARSHAAGLVHFGEVIPDDAGVGVTDERELCRLDVQHELSARFGLLLPVSDHRARVLTGRGLLDIAVYNTP
ncbi:hypothetical protein PLICRDRAFT_30490 [Plicaturopsis crispa FD-325 SS-3]|nr:hypothetical protein PLICRDRAFT_30490 [Plicaturopsis crispa FD-325 SS-3]